jgi:hypothetical protein
VTHRHQGTGGSGDHGEVLPAGFGGDGVLDGIQDSTAMMMAKRHPWFRPAAVSQCGWRLDRGHAVQGSEEYDEHGWIWEMRFIPEIQEDEVEPVARSDGSRCTGASAIACQSLVWRTVRPGRDCYQHSSARWR